MTFCGLVSYINVSYSVSYSNVLLSGFLVHDSIEVGLWHWLKAVTKLWFLCTSFSGFKLGSTNFAASVECSYSWFCSVQTIITS